MKDLKNVKSPFIGFIQKAIPLAYDESLSYYECLCALIKYMKETVTPTLNICIDEVNELEEFVKNYFDSLDIQEKVNEKLDEMAEDGTLEELINQELFTDLNNKITNKITSVETMNSLKAYVGSDNELVQTKGYYSVGDGGHALYRISTSENLIANNIDIIELNDGKKALLQYVDKLNAKCCGAKSGDAGFDNATVLQNLINYCELSGKILYIPEGEFYVTDTLTIKNRITIEGATQPQMWEGNSRDSRIHAMNMTNKPLFAICKDGVPYNWNNATSKTVAGINIKNLRLIGNTGTSRSITGIYACTNISKLENIFVSGFYNGIASAGSYVTIYDGCYMIGCYQGLVLFASAHSTEFNNCWISYGNNAQTGQTITDTNYRNNYSVLNDYHYTCIHSANGKATFHNISIEACTYGVYNRDSILLFDKFNFESLVDYGIYMSANLTIPKTEIRDANWYAPDNFACKLARVGYACYFDIEYMENFPTRGINENEYEISDGGICRVYSYKQGERVVPVTFASGVTNPVIVNKSHYTKDGFVVDIEVTGYDSWNGSAVTKLNIPKCYQNFTHYHVVPTSTQNTIYNVLFKQDGVINSGAGGWLAFSSSSPAKMHLVDEYQIKNW